MASSTTSVTLGNKQQQKELPVATAVLVEENLQDNEGVDTPTVKASPLYLNNVENPEDEDEILLANEQIALDNKTDDCNIISLYNLFATYLGGETGFYIILNILEMLDIKSLVYLTYTSFIQQFCKSREDMTLNQIVRQKIQSCFEIQSCFKDEGTLGFELEEEPGGLFVKKVLQSHGTNWLHPEIKSSLRLIKINEIDVSLMSLEDVVRIVNSVGKPVTLTWCRKGRAVREAKRAAARDRAVLRAARAARAAEAARVIEATTAAREANQAIVAASRSGMEDATIKTYFKTGIVFGVICALVYVVVSGENVVLWFLLGFAIIGVTMSDLCCPTFTDEARQVRETRRAGE